VQNLLGAMGQPTTPAPATVTTPAAAATESTTAVAIPAPEAVPATPAPEPQRVAATTAAPAPAPVVRDEGTGDRIKLTAGKKSTQLRGTAPVNGTRDYVVRAKAGQLLTLSLEGSPSAVFAVYSSRGEIVADLTNWSSKMPRDEDYTIKVGQTKGASGPADFVLNVKVE